MQGFLFKMSNIKISNKLIKSIIIAPPSKSYGQRALIAALLKNGKTVIKNLGISNDELAVLHCIEKLNAKVEIVNKNEIVIVSNFNDLKNKHSKISLNVEESGLALRLIIPIVSLLKNKSIIIGKGSLLNRPIEEFLEILPKLKVEIEATNNKIPIEITGPIEVNDIKIDGSRSSQFLSGFLMAFAYLFSQNSSLENKKIDVINLTSKPYIDITLDVLEKFKFNLPINNNYNSFIFKNNMNLYAESDIEYSVEADWSNAAFLLCAGAIQKEIKVLGLNIDSKQGDKKILEAIEKSGCDVSLNQEFVKVKRKNKNLIAFDFDAVHCPDLFPPLVALAANCNGTSSIKGVHRLLHKESNRAETLMRTFKKMGINISIENDTMYITGGKLKSSIVNSFNDHRIAMACAIASLNDDCEIIIENAEAVKKSYPNFFNDLFYNYL